MNTERPQDSTSGYSALTYIVAFIVLLAIYIGLLLPAFQVAHEPSRRSSCTNNLKEFGIALHNYIEAYHALPPAFVVDEQGHRIHSWRALLLPFFEEEGLRGLYNPKKPWISQNPLVIATSIPVFCCPWSEIPIGHTTYVAVVGPDTAWPGSEPLGIDQITDRLADTIAVVEIATPGVPWADPRDLTFEEALRGINQVESPNGISSPHTGGVNVLFLDGHVEFLPNDTPPETLRALLTANSGEDVKMPKAKEAVR